MCKGQHKRGLPTLISYSLSLYVYVCVCLCVCLSFAVATVAIVVVVLFRSVELKSSSADMVSSLALLVHSIDKSATDTATVCGGVHTCIG